MSPHDGGFLAQAKGQIARELERIEKALREPQTDERYCQLYAAQQALAWALDPDGFASPYAAVQRGLVRPLSCTQEEPINYPAGTGRQRSSDTCDPARSSAP